MRRYGIVFSLAALALAAMLLAACSSSDGGGETPTVIETEELAGGPTPTAATTLPEISSLCDLVTQEDVEEALGESVTGSTEFKDVSCGYSIASGSLNIERGSQEDFELGITRTGDLGEPVPGIGDEAAWYGGDLYGDQGTLSVGQGDFYFQLRMILPGVDLATQLEVAKGLATRAVERIP